MPHDDDVQALTDAMKECLTPHAVALVAAKLRPAYARGEVGREAEAQCQWLADRLVELLGTPGSSDEYNALCEELGL